MSHNNYKKMIFQQTINWLTDLISHNLLRKLVYWLCHLIKASHTHCYLVVSWVKDVYRDFGLAGYFVPWSQRFFLIFLRERDQEQAAKRRQQVAKAMRRERKTSGYLGLESHFHADDSCQTRQIANEKSGQWQFSRHVLISRYFSKWG